VDVRVLSAQIEERHKVHLSISQLMPHIPYR
jgi:hypothetical protein